MTPLASGAVHGPGHARWPWARPVSARRAVLAACASLLWLGACDKTPTTPPKPSVSLPQAAAPGATVGASGDPSVPAADSVFTPAGAPKTEAPTGRSNSAMSAAQESSAMPMPGQNNDHSAPLGRPSSASAPPRR